MATKYKKSAFTLVELLAVLAIITILVGLLIPALAMVRNMAKEAQQKAQLATIEMALIAFKNDSGDYPLSSWDAPGDYCGAQKLCEALVGWDLMGFHPDSVWDSGGSAYDSSDEENRKQRVGPYLELATANVFKLGDLFDNTMPLKGETFVICDVFAVRRITLAAGNIVKAGTPILYYRANTSSKTIEDSSPSKNIYNARDNAPLTSILKSISNGEAHPLGDTALIYKAFYDYITDPKVTAVKWPYRPDSYILISAGVDGLYGTSDDIRNF